MKRRFRFLISFILLSVGLFALPATAVVRVIISDRGADCVNGQVVQVMSVPTQTKGYNEVLVTVRTATGDRKVSFTGEHANGGMAMMNTIGKNATVCKSGAFSIQ